MSAVAALYNVPTTDEEWLQWSFAHAAHHHDINRVIFQLLGLQLPEYVLDPFNHLDANTWAEQHYIMHQNQDAVLGIEGFDLSEVDFSNPEESAGWIFLNASEHYQAAAILGIG